MKILCVLVLMCISLVTAPVARGDNLLGDIAAAAGAGYASDRVARQAYGVHHGTQRGIVKGLGAVAGFMVADSYQNHQRHQRQDQREREQRSYRQYTLEPRYVPERLYAPQQTVQVCPQQVVVTQRHYTDSDGNCVTETTTTRYGR